MSQEHAQAAIDLSAPPSFTEFIRRLFVSDFMPHGHCFFWRPDILWLHVISDGLIMAAYYMIPLTLIYFIWKRKDVPFHWMFLMFGAFIFLCGTTHLFEILTVWDPIYRIQGLVKLATALISVATAFALIPLIPRAISLPSLEAVNRELKRAEQTAHENEERIRSIIENVIHAVVIMNRRGEIIFWNLQAETIFGWTAQEVIGKQMSELIIPPQYREAHKKGLQRFLKTGTGPILNKVIELTALRRDGTEFPIELAVSNNRVKGEDIFSALIRDITERKRAEERLQLVVEAAPNAMIMVDHGGKVNLVNGEAVKLFGYERQELMGKSVEELLPDRFRSQHQAYRAGFFIKPQARAMGAGRELFGLRKDGWEIPIEIGLSPIKTEEGTFVLASIIDITERKRAEEKQTQLMKELESANRELNDFAYVVSHDLKAPLRGIGSAVEWVSADYRDKLDEKGKEILRLLNQRVSLLHSLIDGILEYSRVGRLKETETKVDLNQLMKEVIELLAPPKHIRIEIENTLPAIYAGKVRTQQVFQNLLSNAIKYMDKEQGQIKIGCRPEDGYWEFHVSDNGPGIEKKYFSKVFQIFQTLQQKDKPESTGIGLALVKKIVDLYGGKIWVESTVGAGSTFYFTLPKSKTGDR